MFITYRYTICRRFWSKRTPWFHLPHCTVTCNSYNCVTSVFTIVEWIMLWSTVDGRYQSTTLPLQDTTPLLYKLPWLHFHVAIAILFMSRHSLLSHITTIVVSHCKSSDQAGDHSSYVSHHPHQVSFSRAQTIFCIWIWQAFWFCEPECSKSMTKNLFWICILI